HRDPGAGRSPEREVEGIDATAQVQRAGQRAGSVDVGPVGLAPALHALHGGEVLPVQLSGVGVGDVVHVVRVHGDQRVVPGAAVEGIEPAGARDQRVVAVHTEQRVVAVAAVQDVVPAIALDEIVARAAGHVLHLAHIPADVGGVAGGQVHDDGIAGVGVGQVIDAAAAFDVAADRARAQVELVVAAPAPEVDDLAPRVHDEGVLAVAALARLYLPQA